MGEHAGTSRPSTKNGAIHHRARHSLRGLAEGWRRERSIRDFLTAAAIAVAALGWVAPPPLWWALCLVAAGLALAVENLNAALEALLDRLHPERHPAIGAAKDMASAAALVLNLAALLVLAVALTKA